MDRAKKEDLRGWLTVGPIILYYAIFGLIPLGIVFYYSTLREQGLFGGTIFVGLGNFVTIFTTPRYYNLLITTALIAAFTIALSLCFGLVLAKLMTSSIRGKTFYRTVYYIPVVVSMAIVSQIVNVWLSPSNGTINNILVSLGHERVIWRDSVFWMYFWLVVICTWKGLGATVILFIAGMSAIPTDINEAADIDGAGRVVKFFSITLPNLRAMFVFVLITSIIGAFNIFEPVQLITGGDPDGATKVVLFQIYDESFKNGNFGMGSALSVVVLVILMGLTMLNMKFGQKRD